MTTVADSVGSAGVEVDPGTVTSVDPGSLRLAEDLAADSGQRRQIPVRRTFVRNDTGGKPPLAKLVSRGGRGGAVPIKLYIALIWRSSAMPFQTDIQARKWAALLGLEKPDTLGARRVAKALTLLEGEQLIRLDRRRGEPAIVTLLDESGSGSPYNLPSTENFKSGKSRPENLYFKIPLTLWTKGHIQKMSAPAVAMLLVLLAEHHRDGSPTWFSTERFPNLFALTPTVRSQGTAELERMGLLSVKKTLLSTSTKTRSTFTRDRVRNTYQLRGDARPADDQERPQSSRKKGDSSARKPRPTEK